MLRVELMKHTISWQAEFARCLKLLTKSIRYSRTSSLVVTEAVPTSAMRGKQASCPRRQSPREEKSTCLGFHQKTTALSMFSELRARPSASYLQATSSCWQYPRYPCAEQTYQGRACNSWLLYEGKCRHKSEKNMLGRTYHTKYHMVDRRPDKKMLLHFTNCNVLTQLHHQ